MSAGDENQFIVPPPGVIPERSPAPDLEPEPPAPDDLITLPPGVVDSGTYRMPSTRAPKPSSFDDAPAFFPVGAPGLPVPGLGAAPASAVDEATRTSVGRRSAPAWRLTLPDGRQVLVEQTTLVGRDPARNADWPQALLQPITDSGKTVSKTHAALELTATGSLVVHDLNSTNGVYVSPPEGEGTEVTPGVPELVEDGARLSFGEFVVIVERS